MENSNEHVNVAYSNDVIKKTKDERDQVRTRPQMFLGTDDVYGALNALMEIVVNGADELEHGYGDTVSIVIDENYNIAVSDNGRGVPMDWNESDKKYNWDLVYNQMYASGKRTPGAYDIAAGLNGVGAAVAQFTSLYMRVISRRIEEVVAPNGKKTLVKKEFEMNFKDGYPVGELIRRDWSPEATSSGTVVIFKTDPAVFQDVRYTPEMILERLRRLATVKGGTHYILKYMDNPEIDFCYDGPKAVLDAMVPSRFTHESIQFADTKPVTEIIRGVEETFDVSMNFTFTFSGNGVLRESYHNGLYLIEHGTSVDGLRAGVASVLEAWGKNNGKLVQKDTVSLVDVDEILCFIVSTQFRGDFSSWDGQDKKAIKNGFLKGMCARVVVDKFTEWASYHSDEMGKILTAINEIRLARAKAASYKAAVVKRLSAGVDNIETRPATLTACLSKDKTKTELIIVEGRSAAGSAAIGRDNMYQAIYALKGKIINCKKASLEAIFHNKVVLELVQTCGCGVEVKSKYIKDLPKFDIDKLNYSKIILDTDADDDGAHIQLLVITTFYVLMPSVIKQGRLFIANAPLFLIKYTAGGKRDKLYVYNEKEKDDALAILKNNGATNIVVKRFKGLGEMDGDMMWESVMDPERRRLTPVTWPEDPELFEKTIEAIMGNDLASRRAIIAKYFGSNEDEIGAIVDDMHFSDDMDLSDVENGVDEAAVEEDMYVEAVVD